MDCAVDEIAAAADAHDALAVNSYDLLIVDLDTLQSDPAAFLRKTRAADPSLRHFVLASRAGLDRVATALDHGADDFLIKPIDADELRLRMGALATRKIDKGTAVLQCGPLRLQVMTREVWLDGQPLELSPRERAVLQVLLRGRGNVVSKDYIASRVFGMHEDGTLTAIETYISRLRRKTAHPAVEIKTVHGLGYLLASRP
jgi:DNA-binding response OmpR family regulator